MNGDTGAPEQPVQGSIAVVDDDEVNRKMHAAIQWHLDKNEPQMQLLLQQMFEQMTTSSRLATIEEVGNESTAYTGSTNEPGNSDESMDDTRNIRTESTDDSRNSSMDDPGNSNDESTDDTRSRAESTDESGSSVDTGNGDIDSIEQRDIVDKLFQTELTELERVFQSVSMATHIDRKTARRLAISVRPVLLKVRAAAGKANQDLRSLVQREREAAQQEIQQLKQQREDDVTEQVYQKVTEKFFEQHQAYKEEIQSLKQIITDQEASIEHHKKWCKKWQHKYEWTKRASMQGRVSQSN
jgi:hypothetical protein